MRQCESFQVEKLVHPTAAMFHCRIMLTEAYLDAEKLAVHYGDIYSSGVGSISQMPLNFGMISSLRKGTTAKTIASDIIKYMKAIGNAWPNFNMGNHDVPRVGSRLGQEVF